MFKYVFIVLFSSFLLNVYAVSAKGVEGTVNAKQLESKVNAKEKKNHNVSIVEYFAPQNNINSGYHGNTMFPEHDKKAEQFLFSALFEQPKPKLVCRKIAKSVKECEEVGTDSLTQNKTVKQTNSLDEIIGVRQ